MIGIIDSGIGGLSVARAIWQELPFESTLYLADHAFFPYGNKTGRQITKRLPRLIDWLVKKKVKQVVVACNTITMAAIKSLRLRYSIPFIGTEPAVKQGGTVLATPATARMLPRSNGIQIVPCPGLAEAIEAGRKIDQYLPRLPKNTRIVVLGCTHYILVKDKIQKIYGQNINLVDPSAAIARQTRAVLVKENLLKTGRRQGQRLFFTTGPTKRLRGIIFTKCSL